jgi:hypothetical protein
MLTGDADIGRLGTRGKNRETARDDGVEHLSLLPIVMPGPDPGIHEMRRHVET